MALNLEDPEVKAAVTALIEEQVAGLKSKNAELTRKLAATKEIKPEDYQRALEERDNALAKVAEFEGSSKELKKSVKQLQDELKGERAYTEKVTVDDALTNALVKAGVRPEFLEATKVLLRQNAKVVAEGSERKALLGDKAIADAVAEWAASESGKHFIAAPANGGGGAGGSKGGGGSVQKMSQAEFEKLPQATQQKMAREGTVEILS